MEGVGEEGSPWSYMCVWVCVYRQFLVITSTQLLSLPQFTPRLQFSLSIHSQNAVLSR